MEILDNSIIKQYDDYIKNVAYTGLHEKDRNLINSFISKLLYDQINFVDPRKICDLIFDKLVIDNVLLPIRIRNK